MQEKPTILIVDDEKSVRETIGSLLIVQGYQLIFASNGKEALERAAESSPDLILLDIMMPFMDGFEVCRRLRENQRLREVPIIMITALDDKDSRLQGIQSGADDFISKPFDFTELIARVKTITRFNRYRRLLEERTKFKKIVEILPDGMMVIDSEFIIRLSNETFRNLIHARDDSNIIGKKINIFIAPSDSDEFSKNIQKVISGKDDIVTFETQILKSNGKEFPAECSAANFILDNVPSIIIIVRDNTEQKLAEQAIRESEMRYRSVSELISDFVYAINVDSAGKLSLGWMTDAITRITGFDMEELDEINIEDLVYPLDKFTVNSHLNILTSGKTDVCEFRIINKEGEVRWLRNYGRSIKDKFHNRVISICGAIQDITERVLSERALQENEERYRAIVEDQTELICRFEKNLKLIFINGAFCRCFSRRPIELIGESFIQFVSDEDKDFVIKKLSKLGKERSIINFEHRVILPDGVLHWLQWSVRALFDKHTELVEFQGVGNDITDRKTAEELVKLSEEKYRTLFEESKDVVFVSTPDGRFIDINPSGVELFGFSAKDELVNLQNPMIIYRDNTDHDKIILELKKHGYIKEYELTMKKKNGDRIKVFETSTAVFDSQNKMIGYRGIMHDVTNVKQLEQELIESQKMESIGRLTGGIAHDFNNMLTIIIGHADLAKMHVATDSKAYERILTIQQSAERAAWFTRQLLAFGRKQVLQIITANVNEIIKDFSKMLHRVIGEDIELKVIEKPEMMLAKVDIGQIYQVLLNLTVNARDAMPTGGELVIETSKIIVDEEYCRWHPDAKPGNYIVITVTDTGIGIDKEIVRKIFEPFFTTKKAGEGTGLGLSVVYGIVKQHEGFILVYSEVDKGTTFNIHIPAAEEKLTVSTVDVVQIISGNETILVVEDDETLRNIALDALKYLGYTVFSANNGIEALETFKEKMDSIDLVLIDVVMPKLGGREAIEEMRKIKPDLHYIFTTGYSLNAVHTSFILEENAAVIQKPWSLEILSKKLRDVLDDQSPK
jgi:PAS domain S-box-containing protein